MTTTTMARSQITTTSRECDMGSERADFKELARASLTDHKEIVVSVRSDGGYSIAQLITPDDEEPFYMKGSVTVSDAGMESVLGALLEAALRQNIDVKAILSEAEARI